MPARRSLRWNSLIIRIDPCWCWPPTPGTLISFEIPGGKESAFKFLNALRLIDISNNLGDAKSIVTHPATTTHRSLSDDDRAALGITPGFIRISVGLEDPADVMDDIDQALATAGT